jgi:hypothetical protein
MANFASYALVEIMIWHGLGDLINNFRKKDLALDPLDSSQIPGLIQKLKIPYSYLWYVFVKGYTSPFKHTFLMLSGPPPSYQNPRTGLIISTFAVFNS